MKYATLIPTGFFPCPGIGVLFSFSDIQEKPVRVHREEKKLEFSNFVTIYVSSIGNEFLNYVFEKFIGNGQTVRLGNTQAVI